jgi:uncharacterized protein
MMRPISMADAAALLELNNAHAIELSWLEPERLALLLTQAVYARAIGSIDAFLLALDETATYDSPNFHWFHARYPRFIYIDRVAVALAARRHGHARLLYDDLFRHARAAGHDRVACEVNAEPPNPGSAAFHAAAGFAEVGRAPIHGGAKTVRYLMRDLSADCGSRAPIASAIRS